MNVSGQGNGLRGSQSAPGFQLGQTPGSGLQVGQTSAGLQLGQSSLGFQTQMGGGLQHGTNLTLGQASGLQLGQASGLSLGQGQLGLKLGQGLAPSPGGLGSGISMASGGLQLGQGAGIGQTTAISGGLQLGQSQLGNTQTVPVASGGVQQLRQGSLGFQTQVGVGQQHGTGLALGQSTQASGLQLQVGQASGLSLGQGQLGLKLGQGLTPSSGGLGSGTSTMTSGGLQLGQGAGTGQTTAISGGLQLGQSQLGKTQAVSVASGGVQQLGQGSLGFQTQVGVGQQHGTGLALGQSTQASGLQLQLGQASGLSLGQGQLGLKLGQGLTPSSGGLGSGTSTMTSGGLQLGQGAGDLKTVQTTAISGGLQLGKSQLGGTQTVSVASGGLQLGQNLGGGLKLGQTSSGQSIQVGSGLQTQAGSGIKLGQTTKVSAGLSSGGGLQLKTTGVTTTSTLPLGGIKLGGTTVTATTTTQSGLGVGQKLLPSGGTAAVQGLALQGGKVTTSSQNVVSSSTSFRGLGGVDPNTSSVSNGSSGSIQSVYSTPLPDILAQLVTEFKDYLKKQKEVSDQFGKFTEGNFKEVSHKISTQNQALSVVSSQIQKDSQTTSFLKEEISLELQNAEVAQRTMELPAGLQHENTAPEVYFQNLVNTFEAKMELYRRQIEELESHLSSVSPETGMSSQTIIEILRLQYKPFLLLAAQLQTTHEQVQNLKEQYLSYQKVFLQNSTDVFEERRQRNKLGRSGSTSILTGPPPFSVTAMNQSATALASSVGGNGLTVHNNTLGLPTGTGLGLGTGLGTRIGTGLGTTSLGGRGLGLSQGTSSFGQNLSLGSSLSQPSLGSLSTSASTAVQPGTGTQPFTLQLPPPGKRRNT